VGIPEKFMQTSYDITTINSVESLVIPITERINLERRCKFAENHQYLLYTSRVLLSVLPTDRETVF